MAEALFARYAPDDVQAESAGSDPARQVWPAVVEVMFELGIDLTARKPKRLTTEMQLHADWAVTMGCGDVCPYVPTTVEAWDIPDPAGLPVIEVRTIRDVIDARVRERAGKKIDAIRDDQASPEFRLTRLLPVTACVRASATRRPYERFRPWHHDRERVRRCEPCLSVFITPVAHR